MAFAILQSALGASIAGDTWDGIPANNIQLADQTATCAAQTFVAPVRAVRAFIWQKAYAGGTTANNVNQYLLQVADSVGMTLNLRTIASFGAPLTANAFYMNGIVPDISTSQFCRVFLTLNAGSAVSYDVSLSAT